MVRSRGSRGFGFMKTSSSSSKHGDGTGEPSASGSSATGDAMTAPSRASTVESASHMGESSDATAIAAGADTSAHSGGGHKRAPSLDQDGSDSDDEEPAEEHRRSNSRGGNHHHHGHHATTSDQRKHSSSSSSSKARKKARRNDHHDAFALDDDDERKFGKQYHTVADWIRQIDQGAGANACISAAVKSITPLESNGTAKHCKVRERRLDLLFLLDILLTTQLLITRRRL